MSTTVETEPKVRQPKMPLDQLKQTVEWAALNEAQQTYIAKMSEGLNFIDAAKVAYPKIETKNLRALIFRLDENPKVKAVRDLLFGVSPFDRIILDLSKAAVRAKSDVARVDALKTIAQMKGYLGGPNDAPEPAQLGTSQS